MVLFLLGYYAGKLVAIEAVCLFQLTFYGLAGISDLSPSFYALTFLKYSKGYNMNLITPQASIDRVYEPIGLVF